MHNEALEKAGHSFFFITEFSEFLNAAEMTMQDLCDFTTHIFAFAASIYNGVDFYRNNYRLHDVMQITCYYHVSNCIQHSIKCCLECVERMNNELVETKNKKKKFSQSVFTFTPPDKKIDENDCVYDILKHVSEDYYYEKYKGIYDENDDDTPDGENAEENKPLENINDINISYEAQMDYVRLLADLLSQALYALRLLDECYEIPF